jgi:hypothetical protein
VDGLVGMILPMLQDNWYDILMSVLALGFFANLKVVVSLVKHFAGYVQTLQNTRKDGVLSDSDYIAIGKRAVGFSDEVLSVIKGLLPNRSK